MKVVIVIPTYNEKDNVGPMIETLDRIQPNSPGPIACPAAGCARRRSPR